MDTLFAELFGRESWFTYSGRLTRKNHWKYLLLGRLYIPVVVLRTRLLALLKGDTL